jgi:hypothetical protein
MPERTYGVIEREDGFYVEERLAGSPQPDLSGPYSNRTSANREAYTLQSLSGSEQKPRLMN